MGRPSGKAVISPWMFQIIQWTNGFSCGASGSSTITAQAFTPGTFVHVSGGEMLSW